VLAGKGANLLTVVRRGLTLLPCPLLQVIDALNFPGYDDKSWTAKQQAMYTDLILINKHELVTDEHTLDKTLDDVHELNPETPKVKLAVSLRHPTSARATEQRRCCILPRVSHSRASGGDLLARAYKSNAAASVLKETEQVSLTLSTDIHPDTQVRTLGAKGTVRADLIFGLDTKLFSDIGQVEVALAAHAHNAEHQELEVDLLQVRSPALRKNPRWRGQR
jgi:G3E family GTPase